MAETINKQRLSELQGVSLPTITKWIADGCPVEVAGSNGKGYEFDNAKVTAWRLERARHGGQSGGEAESEASAKRRKMTAEADLAEMKAAEAAAVLVRADAVVEAVQKDLARVKARLMAIPNRIAPMVVGLDEIGAREMIEQEVYSALQELSYIEPSQRELDQIASNDDEIAKNTFHTEHFSLNFVYDPEVKCQIDLDAWAPPVPPKGS